MKQPYVDSVGDLQVKCAYSAAFRHEELEISVQLKPGFGIGNQNQGPVSVSVYEPKLFFFRNANKNLRFLPLNVVFWLITVSA